MQDFQLLVLRLGQVEGHGPVTSFRCEDCLSQQTDGVHACATEVVAYSFGLVEPPSPCGFQLLDPFLCATLLVQRDPQYPNPALRIALNELTGQG